jgi:hypothetical protein
MSLGNAIRMLRDRVLAELNDAHDYFTDSEIAWKFVGTAVQNGQMFSNHNPATGTLTTHIDLANKSRRYVSEQLAEATFQQFISIFESFIFDFLRLWLLAYPQSLGGKKVDFNTILDAPDKDSIALLVVNKELNEVLYDRPAGWFAYLEEKAKLVCPTPGEIEKIAEAKASRDVLVHNRGVAGKTYEAKAGKLARYRDGQRIEIPEYYHREIWELLHNVVADVSNAAMAKAP